MIPAKKRSGLAILRALRANPDGLSLRELGAIIGVDHTTLHLRLAALEREGLVDKQERPNWRSPLNSKHGRYTYRIGDAA